MRGCLSVVFVKGGERVIVVSCVATGMKECG